MTRYTGPSYMLPVLAVLFGGLAWLALVDASIVATGGTFDYALDAPYDALAIAKGLWAAGLGATVGDLAGAAASPLYPLLLHPVTDAELHRLLPLVWNGVGLVIAAVLWGRILWQAGYATRLYGLVLAALGPLALHFSGVAYSGTAHILHLAASLAILSGLLSFLDSGRVGRLLIAGVLLAPLLRVEGLALALLAVLPVLARLNIGKGLILWLLAIGPIAGFLILLEQSGLDPLALLAADGLALPRDPGGWLVGQGASLPDRILSEPGAQVLAAFLVVALVLLMAGPVRRSGLVPLVAVAGLAGAAHLLFGSFGGLARFELYATSTLAAATLAVAVVPGARGLVLLPALALIFAATVYAPGAVLHYRDAGRDMHLQTAQIMRLTRDHLAEPVATDLAGPVGWASDHPVVDLARNNGTGGAGAARFAMLRDPALAADGWQLLATLASDEPARFLPSDIVGFFLTGDHDARFYTALLRDWQSGLPAGATVTFASEVSQ